MLRKKKNTYESKFNKFFPKCEKCQKLLLFYLDDDGFSIKINLSNYKKEDKINCPIFEKAMCQNCKKEYSKKNIFNSEKAEKVLLKINELEKILEYIKAKIASETEKIKNEKEKYISIILNKFYLELSNIFKTNKKRYNKWLKSYQKCRYNYSFIKFIKNFDLNQYQDFKPTFLIKRANIEKTIKYISNLPLKPEFMTIRTNNNICIGGEIFENDYLYYISRTKNFLGLKGLDVLILYNYDLNLIDKLEDKNSIFKVIKISDNINNNYYDFIVYSENKELLFYKIVNSKMFLNYKIYLGLNDSTCYFHQLHILFKLNYIFIIAETEFMGYKYKFLTYELIQNKFQKVNVFSFNNKIYPIERLQITYIPSSNIFYFKCSEFIYNGNKFNHYFVYNLKKHKSDDIYENNDLKIYPNKKKYKIDRDKILFNEEELNESKTLSILIEKIKEYWKLNKNGFQYRYKDIIFSKKKINKSLYLITYDKLNIVYLFELINNKLKLKKMCNLNVDIKKILMLDEDRFIVEYYVKNNGNKNMICSWVKI